MLLTYIKRGNVVTFSAELLDADGNTVTPASVNLYVNYVDEDGNRIIDTIEMVDTTAGTWEAEWDSSVALKGRVHWSVRSFEPSSAQDDQFQLEANLANPDPDETA
jgi:hypothetical protein